MSSISNPISGSLSPITSGISILDFGAAPGTSVTTTTVTGQTAILSGSFIKVFMMGDSTQSGSLGYNSFEHAFLASKIALTAGSVVVGTGFTITAVSPDLKIANTVAVRWEWF